MTWGCNDTELARRIAAAAPGRDEAAEVEAELRGFGFVTQRVQRPIVAGTGPATIGSL